MRDFRLETYNGGSIDALFIGIEGLLNEVSLLENVFKPLMNKPLDHELDLADQIKQRLFVKKAEFETDVNQLILNVLQGKGLLLVDGLPEGWILHIEGIEERAIQEPPTEAIVKGPREAFVESIATNLALIRRRIQHPSLRFESTKIGHYTRSNVTIAYIDGIADPQVVQRLRDRLKHIETDSLLSSGELEQFVEDNPHTIFPTVGNTERPDKSAAMLMEGRIVILVDGDPVALIVPYLFIQSLQNQEDYSSRPYFATFIRLLRLFSYLSSITLPSLYVLALNFHKEVIPSELVVSIAESRQKVPFPLEMELVGLTIAFEIVREAGVRMPRAIGQAVSIVGALILGQVSVQAGFIGAPTIIIVALSSIASFIVTPIAEVAAILRFMFLIPTSLFGFYGFLSLGLAVTTHMVSLTSMGVPYMAPIAPTYFGDWKDAVFRLPFRFLRNRPKSIPNQREKRIEQLPDERKDNQQ